VDVDVYELARKTENYSGADIEEVCYLAKNLFIKKIIGKYRDEKTVYMKAKEEPITQLYFERALKQVKPSLRPVGIAPQLRRKEERREELYV